MDKLLPPNLRAVEKTGDAVTQIADASIDLEYERGIQDALASLQLPHMPAGSYTPLASSDLQPPHPDHLPTITIMVCADIDLKSTSALAEYALQQKNTIFDANAIDLIIAVGPCTRDTDLLHYSQGGKQRTNIKTRRRMQQARQHKPPHIPDNAHHHAMAPFFRTREDSAALEGLMTAALSQLESIVCRVFYCPGWHDPLTVLQPRSVKRLTPNSRNLHQQWLPLAPGIGCAGLFYLDGTERLVADYDVSGGSFDEKPHDDDSDASEEQDSTTILKEQLRKLQQCNLRSHVASLLYPMDPWDASSLNIESCAPRLNDRSICSQSGYCAALSKLLMLAPKPEHPEILFTNGSSTGQSILVTHFVDSQSLVQEDDSLSADGDLLGDCFGSIVDRDGCAENVAIVIEEESSSNPGLSTSLPWPIDHDSFLESVIAQQHLCLEIASGSASRHAPEWISNGTALSATGTRTRRNTSEGPVLLPGSLRERGEFCILQLSLVEKAPGSMSSRRFAWEVQTVAFHRINIFG